MHISLAMSLLALNLGGTVISGCLVSDVRSCVSFKDVKTALLILLALLWKSMMVIWIGLVKVELIRF